MQATFLGGRGAGFPTRTLARLATGLRAAWRGWRERRELAQLSDHMLRDLGLSRGDVDAATGGPVWEPVDYAMLDAARQRCGPRLGAG
jgi:uncharacterized protein YjiS (DUF1127 family)